MISTERNIFPSYKIRVAAKAITPNQTTRSVATEISAELVSIRTERPILPKTPIKILMDLDEKIMFQGNVAWVLDIQTETGEHYYLTGIQTDAIIHPKVKAIGQAEKSRLLQEILFGIMEQKTG